MAAKAKAPEVDQADLRDEIEGGIERVQSLAEADNTDGAAELATEVEGLISQVRAENTGKTTALRKKLRDRLRKAGQAQSEPKAAEVERAPKAEVVETGDMEQLIAMGADRVREVTVGKLKGSRQIAEILLDIRRRIILPDGLPDLKGVSQRARDRGAEVYGRVLSDLPAEGEDDTADGIRAEINSIKKSAWNALGDLRVEYVRSLDTSDAEELKPFASILEGQDGSPAELIAAHYDLDLRTRREIERDRRQAKAALEARKAEGEEISEEEEAAALGEKVVSPADAAKAAVRKIKGAVKAITVDGVDDTEDRKAIREAIADQIDALRQIASELM